MDYLKNENDQDTDKVEMVVSENHQAATVNSNAAEITKDAEVRQDTHEVSSPDASTSDASTSDASTSEASAFEASISEASIPEASAFEASAPETSSAEGQSGSGSCPELAAGNRNQHGYERSESASGSLKTSSFYSESFKKPSKKRFSILQLTAVGLICSILGGSVAGVIFTVVAPSIQPAVQRIAGNIFPGSTTYYANNGDGVLKKYEIEQTTSPVVAIAEKVSPSVVGIRVTFPSGNTFFQQGSTGAEGSGIIIREDGYVITNNHVISSALDASGKISKGSTIDVYLPGENKKSFAAEVVGNDERTDLAVLKINAKGLPTAELGDSDKVKVGDIAVAIGNPAGMNFMGSVTSGIISGLDRPMDNMNELNMIQTDASINEGNSGGALANSQGQVIGINTLKIGSNGFEGMGFSIPINKAKEIIDSLITSGYVKGRPPVLNVTVALEYNAEAAEYYGWPEGVYVKSVVSFGAAYRAGIKENDIITSFDGKRVKTYDELNEQRAKHKAGDKVKVEVFRNGETKTFEVTLEEDKG